MKNSMAPSSAWYIYVLRFLLLGRQHNENGHPHGKIGSEEKV